jgi:hypothetical protein
MQSVRVRPGVLLPFLLASALAILCIVRRIGWLGVRRYLRIRAEQVTTAGQKQVLPASITQVLDRELPALPLPAEILWLLKMSTLKVLDTGALSSRWEMSSLILGNCSWV